MSKNILIIMVFSLFSIATLAEILTMLNCSPFWMQMTCDGPSVESSQAQLNPNGGRYDYDTTAGEGSSWSCTALEDRLYGTTTGGDRISLTLPAGGVTVMFRGQQKDALSILPPNSDCPAETK